MSEDKGEAGNSDGGPPRRRLRVARKQKPQVLIAARHSETVPVQLRKQRADAVTPRRMDAFFAVLADTCNISEAARQSGISRSAVSSWRVKDAEFKRRFDLVLADAHADLQMRLLAIARDGVTGEQWEETDADGVTRLRYRRDATGVMQWLLDKQQAAATAAEAIAEPERAPRETLDELIDRLRDRIGDMETAEAGRHGAGQ